MTRGELNEKLNSVQKAIYEIMAKEVLSAPDCAIEEIVVYLVIGEVPSLYDWRSHDNRH